jgi:hypothetical protein
MPFYCQSWSADICHLFQIFPSDMHGKTCALQGVVVTVLQATAAMHFRTVHYKTSEVVVNSRTVLKVTAVRYSRTMPARDGVHALSHSVRQVTVVMHSRTVHYRTGEVVVYSRTVHYKWRRPCTLAQWRWPCTLAQCSRGEVVMHSRTVHYQVVHKFVHVKKGLTTFFKTSV